MILFALNAVFPVVSLCARADGQLAGQVVVWTTLFSGLSIFCLVLVFKALGVF